MKKKIFFILMFVLFLLFFINISDSYGYSFYDERRDFLLEAVPDEINENTHFVVSFCVNWSPGYYCYYYTNDDDFDKFVVNNRVLNSYNFSGNSCSTFLAETGVGVYNIIDKNRPWESVDRFYNSYHTVIYSTDDIYNADGTIFYSNKYNFDITYKDNNSWCQITSGNFDIVDFDNVICEISSDGSTFIEVDKETSDIDDSGNPIKFQFYYNIFDNGTYKIRFKDKSGKVLVNTKIVIDEINKDAYSLNLHLSTEEHTTDPIYVLSNKYYYEGDYNAADDFLNNYDIDVAYGLESPYEFSPFSIDGYDEEKNMHYRQYQYKIVINGIYKFRIVDMITGEISYQTFNITNIGVKNPYGDDVYYNNYNEKSQFDPTPVLFLEYVDTTTVRIRTQPFIFNELMYLECYTSNDFESNYERNNNIYKYSVDTGNSSYDYNTGQKQNILDMYYFYLDVKVDGVYYFKFYNIDLKKETSAFIEVNIREFLQSNIDNIKDNSEKMDIWVHEHLGVLVFPFEFIGDLVSRFYSIQESEPILHFPELRDPTYNYKLSEAVDFNFNSILVNDSVKFIHDFYLIIIDVIFAVFFIVFCKKTFEEVFPSA